MVTATETCHTMQARLRPAQSRNRGGSTMRSRVVVARTGARDKARCVNAAIYLPSYVEWLTCIEGESTLRRIRKGSGAAPPG
jgi:hypothetical protein